MLKSHQVKRCIERQLKKRLSDYHYLGCARGAHFLLQTESANPHRLLSLRLDLDERQLVSRSGVSFFERPGQLSVAQSLSAWQELPIPLAFGSKKSARAAIERFFRDFQPTEHAAYALLERKLEGQDRWFSFWKSHSTELLEPDSPALSELKRGASAELYREMIALARLGAHEPEAEEELDLLLDSLAEEGRYQETASFSLDRSRALQKLSDYQLGDPVLFPLFLSVGLALLGATRLEIEIDSDETWVRYQGVSLGKESLQRLPGVLLASQWSAEDTGLAYLAKALLQAAGREPSQLQLDREQSLDLSGFPADLPESEESAESGTFYRRARFGMKVVKRFVDRRKGDHPEVTELREALAYVGLPWTLNGEEFSGHLTFPQDSVRHLWRDTQSGAVVEFDAWGSQAKESQSPIPATVLCLLQPGSPGGLTAVMHRMEVGLPEQSFRPTTRLVVWLPEMALDLSGRQVVGCQLLEEILAVLPALEEQTWAQLLETFPKLEATAQQAWVGPLLRHLASSGKDSPLWSLSFLPVVGPASLISPGELRELRNVYFATENFEYTLRGSSPVVHLAESDGEAGVAFHKLFSAAIDATATLRRLGHYYRSREAWLSQPQQEPALEVCHEEFQLETPDGVIGLSEMKEPPLKLLCQGRELPSRLRSWVPPYVEIVLSNDHLDMDDAWQQVQPPEILEGLRNRILGSLVTLLDRLQDHHFEHQHHRAQMRAGLRFLKKNGLSMKHWEERRFIKKGRTLVSLRDQPQALEEPD